MYLLNEFKEKNKSKELTTKQLRNKALIDGALVVPGLVVAGNDLRKGINLIKNTNNLESNLAKNKAGLIATHPDKFIGKDESVIKAATDKFKQLSSEKDKLFKIKDAKTELDKVKGIGKLKKAIGLNIENDLTPKLENLAKIQGKKINPKKLPKFLKGAKLIKKVEYGLTALGAIGAGIAAAKYINRKRKEREDKGKIRGKYSK